jgi:hypothetical protein
MTSTWKYACAALLAVALQCDKLNAATVGFVGSTEGAEVSEWLTQSTPKSFDIDGDNRYGSTIGAVHWTILGYQQQASGSPTLGWAYLGETSFGQFRNADYPMIDDLSNPAADVQAAIGGVHTPGSFRFELTGQASDYAGKVVRVGVMADVLGPTEWAQDIDKQYQIRQITGGLGDSGLISLRGGGPGNGNPDMYFFDLAGVNPGDQFEVVAYNGAGVAGYVGPISWDIGTAIPEPSTWALLAIGSAGLFAARRRRA